MGQPARSGKASHSRRAPRDRQTPQDCWAYLDCQATQDRLVPPDGCQGNSDQDKHVKTVDQTVKIAEYIENVV